MIHKVEQLESHVGIEPAKKLKDLSVKGLYDVTHPEQKFLEIEKNKKKRRRY